MVTQGFGFAVWVQVECSPHGVHYAAHRGGQYNRACRRGALWRYPGVRVAIAQIPVIADKLLAHAVHDGVETISPFVYR